MKKALCVLCLPILSVLSSCSSPAEGALIFSANGGTFSDHSTTKTLRGKSGETIEELGFDGPTNGDRVFTGWSEKADGHGSKVTSFKYPYYIDYTLYASWADRVVVSYVTGLDSLTYDPMVGYEGKKLILPQPEVPAWRFLGWYSDAAFATAFAEDKFPSSALTLYAKFEEFPTLRLHYDLEVVSYRAKAGSPIEQIFDIPVRDGQSFVGWYREANFTSQFYFDRMPGVSLDLYPKFSKTVTIRFDSNGGSSLSPLSGPSGEKIAAIPESPVLALHSFDGWYSSSTFEDETKFKFDTELYPETDLTLYARWSSYPTISFVVPNEIAVDPISPWQLLSGSVLPDLPVPTAAGFEFLGWYYRDSTGAEVLFDELYMPAASCVLTAKFQAQRQVVITSIYKGETQSSSTLLLDKATTVITGQWWNANYRVPDGYMEVGKYSDSDFTTKINLPYSPDGNCVIFVKLTREVTVEFYEGSTLRYSLQGGEGLAMYQDQVAESLKKDGYSIEGLYFDSGFTTEFPCKVFPSSADGQAVKVYINYLKR